MNEIIEKGSRLKVYEERCISDDYDEIVIYNKEMNEWHHIFKDFFGEPVKPVGAKPTADDLGITKAYGGIFNNQTLFKKECDDVLVIAMLWPWQNNVHTTLKIARIRK